MRLCGRNLAALTDECVALDAARTLKRPPRRRQRRGHDRGAEWKAAPTWARAAMRKAIAQATFAPGPMTVLVDQEIASHLHYSPLECAPAAYLYVQKPGW